MFQQRVPAHTAWSLAALCDTASLSAVCSRGGWCRAEARYQPDAWRHPGSPLLACMQGLQLSMAALEASLAREYEALNSTALEQQRLEAEIAALQAQDGGAQE